MRVLITLSACLLLASTSQLHGEIATVWSGASSPYTGTFGPGTVTATVSDATSNIAFTAQPGSGDPANPPGTPVSTLLPLGVGEVVTGDDTGENGAMITLDFTNVTFGPTDAFFVGNINTESPLEVTARVGGVLTSVTWSIAEVINGGLPVPVPTIGAPAGASPFASAITGGEATPDASALWLRSDIGGIDQIKLSWTGTGTNVLQVGVAIPEPSSFAFLSLVGFIGIGFCWWRKRTATN